MMFTQHYSGSPVCAPSRCVLLTGKHTGHATVRGNRRVPLRPDDVTVAEVLRDAGHGVTLAIPNQASEAEAVGDGISVVTASPASLGAQADGHDWVLLHGHLGNHYLSQRDDLPVVIDLYDPFLVENLHYHRELGFALVLVFMAVYYKVFGLVANLALVTNLVLIVAVLSILQATLTLPGIAGIVLTVGMAVDANVLIFERIREELRIGSTPQASIHAGYAKAFSTILDANITTFIAAVVLFSIGSGPVRGFAVTLAIGILTSMFTAIIGTRSVINLIYGAKRIEKLSI